MNKFLVCLLAGLMTTTTTFALDAVFDSMDKATEVKLAPAIKSSTPSTNTQAVKNVNSVYSTSIKEQKFNSALVNLDDAQVELRQELATTTAKYNEAVIEKNKMIANCKALKKEIREINKKMKNVDKSKKIINKNLQTAQ
ncbi:MAG: hypothetical protein E7Z88_08785 [Cyanobacteria bacterium SIG27]|nr:hypothetical protein [Cyanobacteria bacterium SIG27]MBQ9150427.1 hypothetical protein [bacterium]